MKTGINNLKAELINLKENWSTHSENKKQLDANWVGVTIPNWRLAKKAGAKKDGYYGWILWSGSTQDNGTNFAHEVSEICSKYDVRVKVRECQL